MLNDFSMSTKKDKTTITMHTKKYSTVFQPVEQYIATTLTATVCLFDSLSAGDHWCLRSASKAADSLTPARAGRTEQSTCENLK